MIAAFKSLGATSGTILAIHLLQVLMIAGIGIVLGIALGFLIPVALTAMVGDALPIKADLTVSARSLLTAVGYGLLVSLLFALWPLGRAEQVRAGVLFRDEVAPERVLPRRRILAFMLGAGLLLAGLAISTAEARLLALYYCLGVIGVFAVFVGLGNGIAWAARRVARPRRPELALAIRNLGAPGGLTRSVVLSLGTGLSLLVTVALVDASIINELTSRLPEESPNYFVLDIKPAEIDAFHALVTREAPAAKVAEAPHAARPRDQARRSPGGAGQGAAGGAVGAQRRPRPHLFASRRRRARRWLRAMVAGRLRRRAAGLLRGRHRQGAAPEDRRHRHRQRARPQRHGAHRQSARGEMGEPFPQLRHGVLAQHAGRAPANLLATITLPKNEPVAVEAKLAQQIGRAFPASTAIRVKDAIDAFNVIFGRVMVAVRAAGSVTLLAGAFVLAGALATAQRRRIQQAVILKTLGATSRRILLSHLAEYAVLAGAQRSFPF